MNFIESADYFALVLFNSESVLNFELVLIPILLGIGVRTIFLFKDWNNWITIVLRCIFGVLPIFLSIGLLALSLSPSIAISHEWLSMQSLVSLFIGLCIGGYSAHALGRHLEPRINAYMQRSLRPEGDATEFTDIRSVNELLPEFDSVDLVKQFSEARKDDAIFLGVNAENSPVVIDRAVWKKSHVQVMGAPGTGKGVVACGALTQALAYGDAVYVFDPKNDEWAPSVLKSACDELHLDFLLVDLTADVPQINPIRDATSSQIAELFYAGFQLGQRGDPSDFYRLDDRNAARQTASLAGRSDISISELLSESKSRTDGELVEKAKGFFAALEEVAEIASIQTSDGVNLSAPLRRGGCIYIVGSIRDEAVITLQKMFFVRVVQLVENSSNNRHCTVFLDEFKYMLSRPALNALGTIRDKGCNILLAHQSLGDFADCGADLQVAGVRSTVVDTTPIKWLYRPADYETARWISNQTGQIVTESQRRTIVTNPELSRIESSERSIGDAKRNLVDTNMVLQLPDRCAVCVGAGVPTLARTTPIQVDKTEMRLHAAKPASSVGVDVLERVSNPVDLAIQNALERMRPDLINDKPELKVLAFLYDEVWTHSRIVESLLNWSESEVVDLMEQMASKKWVKQYVHPSEYGPSEQIWGLLTAGCTTIQELSDVVESPRVFRKSMVNPTSLIHQLDLQKLRIRAERAGWSNWLSGSKTQPPEPNTGRPDAISVRPGGVKVAIELERTIKNLKRYPSILTAHLEGRRLGYWDEIYYILPEETQRMRLTRIFESIEYITYKRQNLKLTAEHRSHFRIFSFEDDWSKRPLD